MRCGGLAISHSCFSIISSIFLPKSYSRVLQHLCCLPKLLLTGCCQEYWVCDVYVSDIACITGHRFLLLRRSPATHQSSGQAQLGSPAGDFTTLTTDSALQVSLFKRRVNSLYRKNQLPFSPPVFTSKFQTVTSSDSNSSQPEPPKMPLLLQNNSSSLFSGRSLF